MKFKHNYNITLTLSGRGWGNSRVDSLGSKFARNSNKTTTRGIALTLSGRGCGNS